MGGSWLKPFLPFLSLGKMKSDALEGYCIWTSNLIFNITNVGWLTVAKMVHGPQSQNLVSKI